MSKKYLALERYGSKKILACEARWRKDRSLTFVSTPEIFGNAPHGSGSKLCRSQEPERCPVDVLIEPIPESKFSDAPSPFASYLMIMLQLHHSKFFYTICRVRGPIISQFEPVSIFDKQLSFAIKATSCVFFHLYKTYLIETLNFITSGRKIV